MLLFAMGLWGGGSIARWDTKDGEAALPAEVFESDRIHLAVQVLKHLPASQKLLRDLALHLKFSESEMVNTLFQWSTVSKTNAVLTRSFNPETQAEQKEQEITVFLRRNQSFLSLVLDMAHEMTHALYSPTWDPYDPELTGGRYLWVTIEGPGGEVDALVMECQVALEMVEKYGTTQTRCSRYVDPKTNKIDRSKIVQDFYRVGKSALALKEKLGDDAHRFPFLSGKPPKLFSSTGKAPYPVALLQEYDEITRVACENTRERLRRLRKVNRSVALHPPGNSKSSTQTPDEKLLSRRCAGLSIASYSPNH